MPADSATTRLEFATLGEAMACIRSTGSLALGDPVTLSIAGAESNVAIGLARLGHSVAFFGVVGPDSLGSLVRRTLRAEGVAVAGVRTSPSVATGIISFERAVAGRTSVDYFRANSAGSTVAPADAHALVQSAARIIHLSGITPALSISAAAAVQLAVDEARSAGSLVSFDINFRSKLWTSEAARQVLRPIAERADIVFASEDELRIVAADQTASVDEMVAEFTADTGRQLIVKRGSAGASGYLNGTRVDHAAFRIVESNTVGAGDAFAAGYLSGVVDGLDLGERLGRGCALGAFAVASGGDWEGLPDRSQLSLLAHPVGEALR